MRMAVQHHLFVSGQHVTRVTHAKSLSRDGPQMGDVAGRYGHDGITHVDAQPALFIHRNGIADNVVDRLASGHAPESRW